MIGFKKPTVWMLTECYFSQYLRFNSVTHIIWIIWLLISYIPRCLDVPCAPVFIIYTVQRSVLVQPRSYSVNFLFELHLHFKRFRVPVLENVFLHSVPPSPLLTTDFKELSYSNRPRCWQSKYFFTNSLCLVVLAYRLWNILEIKPCLFGFSGSINEANICSTRGHFS